MQQTDIYKLNLLENSDTFSTQPINENMAKIEEELETAKKEATEATEALSAQITRMAFGTYIGTGTSGSDAPNSLTFAFPPKFLLIWTGSDTYRAVGHGGGKLVCYYTEKWGELTTTWSGNTVSWYAYVYSGDGSRQQLNSSNVAYQYLALG